MRPDRLNPLFAEAASLKGVGPLLARPMERLGLTRVKDLAYHLPDRFVQRRAVADLDEASVGENIVVALTPVEYRSSSGRGPFRVLAADGPGNICALTYFGRNSGWAKKQLPLGEKRWIAGRLDQFDRFLQIVHPDHVSEESSSALGQLTEPVYPLSEGLTQGRVAALVQQALKQAPPLPEWIEPGLLDRMKWPQWRDAIELAHKGEHAEARERLAYDELLANSLALMLVRNANRARTGMPLRGDGRLRDKLALPFALTGAQRRSIQEIEGDLAQAAPMLRLLQGDVGSGKTMVALESMLIAVEAGAQAALLAPTEILARQHFETLRRMAAPTGVEVALFTGRDKGKAREAILMGLMDGAIQIVVGTHAIFQDTVSYKNLALVVIDEQHRFGVGQRLMLTQKGKRTPHCLAMTATPIPRTLTLAQYGEMDVSRLDEMPLPPGDHTDEEQSLLDEHIVVFRIDGPLFFAAAHDFLLELAEVGDVRVVVLRMSRVTTIDATGASVLADIIGRLERRGTTVLLSGVQSQHERVLTELGVYAGLADERHLFATTPEAIEHARLHARRLDHAGWRTAGPER